MAHPTKSPPDLQAVPMLKYESLYVGIDVGKQRHVAGFVSTTLLERHQRFEACPALAFEQAREGCAFAHGAYPFLRAAQTGVCAAGTDRTLPPYSGAISPRV